MLSLRRLGLLSAVVALFPAIAHAQGTTNFNVAAGLTLATGDFGRRNESGYNVILGAGTSSRGAPYGFRGEVLYNEFNQKGVTGTSHAGGATLNLTYNLISATSDQATTLYGIGGIGYYSTHEPFYSSSAESNFGWNLGGGFRFPLSGFSAYIEARYHYVSSNVTVTFLPISFGLLF